MIEYISTLSCDTAFFSPLEGVYSIHKYTLEPCEIRGINQKVGTRNFTISFPFTGLPEIGLSDNEKVHNSFINQLTAIEEAKVFIAWLSVATRQPLQLSHKGFGDSQHFGPSSHQPVEDINREMIVSVHHLLENTKEGTFEDVERPNYERSEYFGHTLKIPRDILDLTMKLYSLPEEQREMFFDACLSYQFAMIHSGTLPSVSLVALVSVVESFMRHRFSSGYCKDAQRRCNLKYDVLKKFRTFFQENLVNPLPDEIRTFLNDVYGNRSNFVHQAFLGSGSIRGPSYMSLGRDRELSNQLAAFEKVVNPSMINWLGKI